MLDITCIPVPLRTKIKNVLDWLEFNKITEYQIVPTKEGKGDYINIFQDVTLFGILKHIPVKIGKIEGNLNVSHNHYMTSFKNMPNAITGNLVANSIGISEIDFFPSTVGGDITMNNCKNLTDISGIKPKFGKIGSLTVCFSSIGNIKLPSVSKIEGNLNMSNNRISTIEAMSTKVEVVGDVTLSDNLIANPDMFIEALTSKHHDFYGNPCKSIDEWETTCNW